MISRKIALNNNKPRLWTKAYILTLIAIFSISITMTLFMPLLPIYIKMIGGNSSLTGLVVSIYTFAALVCRPIFAVLIDKYGRKSILIIGFVLIVIGCFAYQFITVIGVLLIARIVHGIGYSASSNATGTIVADIVPKERRGQGIGYYGFVTAASLALGPALGLLIMKNSNMETAFSFAAILAVIGLIASSFISHKRKTITDRQEDNFKPIANHNSKQKIRNKSKFNIGYEKTALPASLIMLLVAFAYSGIVTYLPTYAGTLGIEHISAYFIIYALVLLVTRMIVDLIIKKHDISVVLLPGIIFMVIAFILLGIGKTLPYFLIAAIFYAIGFGSVQPTLNTIVISLCAPSKRGAANATFFSSMDLGIGLGAFVWGIVSQTYGYTAIYFGCAGFMVVAIVAYLILFKRKRRDI